MGNRKSLQCHYHGWTYGLDGALRACPEMDETEEFRKEDFGLLPVRVDRWGPFVFVNLDPTTPRRSAEVMGAIPDEVARAGYDVDRMRLRRAARVPDRVQLEGLRRQLPRGLPPPDRAPAALPRARLRRLPGRDVPLLLEAARPDPGAEAGRGDRSRPALPAHGRRRGGRPLLLALPQHDVQHLPRQHVVERHPAAGARPDADHLRMVLRRAGDGRRLGIDAADASPSPTRSSRRTSCCASRSSAACARASTTRALRAKARERRLPLRIAREALDG